MPERTEYLPSSYITTRRQSSNANRAGSNTIENSIPKEELKWHAHQDLRRFGELSTSPGGESPARLTRDRPGAYTLWGRKPLALDYSRVWIGVPVLRTYYIQLFIPRYFRELRTNSSQVQLKLVLTRKSQRIVQLKIQEQY